MITRHVLMLAAAVDLDGDDRRHGVQPSRNPRRSPERRPAGFWRRFPLVSWSRQPTRGSVETRGVADVRPCSSTEGPPAPRCQPSNRSSRRNLPNVRVSFVLQEISHRIVANGGVNGDPGTFVEWSTTSAAASEEHGGPYGYPLPGPGVTWDGDDLYHTIIYDALVLNACENFPVFPVEHDALIENNGSEIGAFHGSDNSTLDHTGYYNFSYKARATGVNGKVSDFLFSGKVNVTCSGLNSLP